MQLFLQGNEACGLSAIMSKCKFFAGYPITPSTEIAEYMAKELPKNNGFFIQMEDEIASISACIGASWAGAKSMTATSGPGFSLMQENIGFACMTETPLVIVNVMRSGPSTGQATKLGQGDIMQSRFGSHGDYEIIALSPNSVQEFFDLTIMAFNLSEKYRVPVIILADEEIGHIREKITIPKKIKIINRKKPKENDKIFFGKNAPMPKFGDGFFVHVTGSTHKENGMRDVTTAEVHRKLVKHLLDKIYKNKDKIIRYEEKFTEDAEILIVSYGCSSRPSFLAVKKAREKGIKVGYFRAITIWPSPEKRLRELSEKIDKIILVEHSLRGYKPEIERIICKELIHFPKIGGEIHTSEQILKMIKKTKTRISKKIGNIENLKFRQL